MQGNVQQFIAVWTGAEILKCGGTRWRCKSGNLNIMRRKRDSQFQDIMRMTVFPDMT